MKREPRDLGVLLALLFVCALLAPGVWLLARPAVAGPPRALEAAPQPDFLDKPHRHRSR